LTDDELAALGAATATPCQVPLPTVDEEDLDQLTRAAGRGMRSLAARAPSEGQALVDLIEKVAQACSRPPRVIAHSPAAEGRVGDLLHFSMFLDDQGVLVHLLSPAGVHAFFPCGRDESVTIAHELMESAIDAGHASLTLSSRERSIELTGAVDDVGASGPGPDVVALIGNALSA
jgi:hypothetical protein